MTELFEKGWEFISNIKPSEKVSVFYHNDMDGLTSALLMRLFLDRVGVKAKFVSLKSRDEKSLSGEAKKVDKVIILDVPLAKLPAGKILYVDHHPMKDFNSRNIVYVNPRLEFPEIYQPVCYIIYKLLSERIDIKKNEWVAVLGTIADYGYEDCRDLLDKWIMVKTKDGIWNTIFGRVAIKINGSFYYLKGDEILKIVASSRGVDELNKNKKINLAWEKYRKIYTRAKKEFYKNKGEIKKANLVISTVSGNERVNLGSAISTELSRKYSKNVLVVIEITKKIYKVHARYQSGNIHMGKLMDLCSKGIGTGGGHKQAAAASIRLEKDKLDLFKKRLIKHLTDFSAEIS